MVGLKVLRKFADDTKLIYAVDTRVLSNLLEMKMSLPLEEGLN